MDYEIMGKDIRLGFMASGGGSSVENIVARILNGKLEGFEPAVVLCNRSKEEAGVYNTLKKYHWDVQPVHAPTAPKQLELLQEREVDLVLGLGYDNLVGNEILDYFPNRVLNIHPTLLPKHGGKGMYGLATHMSVLESGDEYTGVTIHIMNSEYDGGRRLRKLEIPVPDRLIGKPSKENAKELQQHVLQEEYREMPRVLELIRDGELLDFNNSTG